MKKLCLFVLIAALLCAMGGAYASTPKYYGRHGTAKFIGGRTLIVTIVADDPHSDWYDLSRADFQTELANYMNGMTVGLRWLEQQVAGYGVNAEFVIDDRNVQTEHFTAFYGAFQNDLTVYSNEGYRELREFIAANVDTEDLMDYFRADNVVYAVFLNAPSSEDYRSYAITANYNDLQDDQVIYEMAVFTPYGHGRRNTPAVYAHEVLHTFGAADLYQANPFVPQSYVDYLTRNQLWELMNHCYFSEYDRVTTPFTDVDAYFVGLIPTCADVETFDLGPSIFERYH